VGIVALAHRSSVEETSQVRTKYPARRPSYSPPQRQREPEVQPFAAEQEVDTSAAAAGAVFLGVGMAFLIGIALFGILIVVAQILILVWVVKDARARGADGGIWLIVILLTDIVGLLVYLASRPSGLLVPCSHCGNRRLDYLHICPICGRE
jgi:disulfide bond formation protein DsbB